MKIKLIIFLNWIFCNFDSEFRSCLKSKRLTPVGEIARKRAIEIGWILNNLNRTVLLFEHRKNRLIDSSELIFEIDDKFFHEKACRNSIMRDEFSDSATVFKYLKYF